MVLILPALIFTLLNPSYLFWIETKEPEPLTIETIKFEPVIDSETYIITAYTAGPESTGKSPGHPEYGKTASGKYVQENVTAACPPELEFGTVIEIEGLGERVCHDRGGLIKGKKIDIYMPYVSDALQWGVQEREVRIVSE